MLRKAPKRVLGVLAGRDMGPDLLRPWADSADVIFAADSGADRLLEAGGHPHIAIGDLDSISERARGATPNIHFDPNQDRTDCDKLLAAVRSGGESEVTLACVEGDRLEHVLATLSSALQSGLRVRLALRRGIGIVMRAGDRVEVETEPSRLVS